MIEHPRFKDIYLIELFDFLSDEDSHIQIDAIEAFTEIMDELDEEQTAEFVQGFLSHLVIDEDTQLEISLRVASIFGQVLHKL